MPIYEYRCKKCDHRFEKLVREGVRVRCPSCGSGALVKLFSTFGVKSGDGFTASAGGSCGTCQATSCKGCSKA